MNIEHIESKKSILWHEKVEKKTNNLLLVYLSTVKCVQKSVEIIKRKKSAIFIIVF